MARETKNDQPAKRQTKTKDLPRPVKELTNTEAKKVKGGAAGEGSGWPAFTKPPQQ